MVIIVAVVVVIVVAEAAAAAETETAVAAAVVAVAAAVLVAAAAAAATVLFWNVSGLIYLLSFLTQSVFAGHESTPSVLKCGVLQGSVLGPLLFTLCTQSVSTVICQSGHSYHFFADNSQLYNSSIPSNFQALVHSLKDMY